MPAPEGTVSEERPDPAAAPPPAVLPPRVETFGNGRRVYRALRRGIGPRLLVLIVLFSSAVTLVSTLVQLYFDYRRDITAIESRLEEIERSYLGSLAASLWHVDVTQIRLQLEGLQRLPDMQALEVRETAAVERPLLVAVGRPADRLVIDRAYPLIYNDRGVAREIGILKVEASLAEVYQRLTEKAVVILVTQGLKTFLVSLFILYVFYRLVTRHLTDIARTVGGDDLQRPAPALTLQRRPPPEPDELDRMVQAFNAMRANLQDAYDELRVAHDELADDIIARRRAEDEVKRLNAVLEQRVRQRTAELEAANKELGAFSYSVAHDLRAPLRRIEGFGRILVEDYTERLDARGLRYLGRIRAGVHDMTEMIDSFLRLSRATQGELSVEPVDLSRQARIIANRLREKDPGRDVFVDIEADMLADGDRRLLSLVLENLLDNAWKYTRRTEGATITFSRQRDDRGHAVYVVRDNGAGFDMAMVDRLFAPFSRLHRAEDFEGTGIGLATVQRILARHGGRIWATAEPGRGARFHFTLWEKEEGVASSVRLRGHHEEMHHR